jgi:phosphoribosylaminoimidazole (AIR) synthetase
MMEKDDYIKNVIGRGDDGSRLLARICAPTLKNSDLVEIVQEGVNGLAVLNIPKDYLCVVHSLGGMPEMERLDNYVNSMVSLMVDAAKGLSLTPVGFANVIDASEGKKGDIIKIGNRLVEMANNYKLPILNGELAILGNRVNCTANIMGTMISIVPRDILGSNCKEFESNGIAYAAFDPEGDCVWINSDGIGTKTEFYERLGMFDLGFDDSLAMKLDDTIKIGARARVVSDVVETNKEMKFGVTAHTAHEAIKKCRKSGFSYILQHEMVGNRIRGYKDGVPSYNISGSAVSTINRERLKNLPRPYEGDTLVAIRGPPNPRSNGITDKRRMMIKLFGEEWHKTKEGKIFLDYLAQPSVVLYPVFRELLDTGAATSVFHMSGGAYDGKLARPIAKYGLFAEITDLFRPDYRELALMGASETTMETAYAKCPMGNDGFISTGSPKTAIPIIQKHGLEAKVAGIIKKCDRTGVELTAINGKKVYYSGK